MLSEEKCQLLAFSKRAVRGTAKVQAPPTITSFKPGRSTMIDGISLICASHFQLWKHFPVFLLCCSLCRWGIREVPGVGRCRPVHIRYFSLCSATPQDPPPETGAQRYRLPFSGYLFYSLSTTSRSTRITAIACQLPLCEASQRNQAACLATTAQTHRARKGHLTHIRPLFCHQWLTPAAYTKQSVLLRQWQRLLCLLEQVTSSRSYPPLTMSSW